MGKILVVDQDQDLDLLIRQYFREKIANGAYTFIFTHSLQEANQILEHDQAINCVICDLKVTANEEVELLDKIAALDHFCKAIVISAYGDMSTVRLAMNRGAFDFIMKPIDFKDLELSLERLNQLAKQSQESKAIKTELKDLEKQLDVARAIQQSFLPNQFSLMPRLKSSELFGTMIPAKHVGGDFFDFFQVGNDKIGLVIADVAGKGVPAALFMAVSRTVIRTLAMQSASPLDTIQKANQYLNSDNDTALFVTAFYGVFNPKTGLLTFCNAGHNPPLLITQEGKVRPLEVQAGLPLGILKCNDLKNRVPYQESTLQMQQGDTLVMYTDGINEAMSEDQSIYGLDRFINTLIPVAKAPLPKLVHHVMQEVQNYTKPLQPSDDCTLLCLRFLG